MRRRELAEFTEFRDRLRADPESIAAYIAAKKAIIAACVLVGGDYARAKGHFITGLGEIGAEDA